MAQFHVMETPRCSSLLALFKALLQFGDPNARAEMCPFAHEYRCGTCACATFVHVLSEVLLIKGHVRMPRRCSKRSETGRSAPPRRQSAVAVEQAELVVADATELLVGSRLGASQLVAPRLCVSRLRSSS